VQDFGDRSGSLYLATPWVNGPSLRAVLDQRRRLDPAHVRQLATQIASALDAAAAVRLIHLDIKPENVLFASAEDVVHSYVTDFGAGSLAAREVGADPSRSFRGTFEYAAPEQLQRGSIDRRAMVYSLGCLLYETLTGRTPYAGRPRDAARLEQRFPQLQCVLHGLQIGHGKGAVLADYARRRAVHRIRGDIGAILAENRPVSTSHKPDQVFRHFINFSISRIGSVVEQLPFLFITLTSIV
jgi:serine/threonine protein kinase